MKDSLKKKNCNHKAERKSIISSIVNQSNPSVIKNQKTIFVRHTAEIQKVSEFISLFFLSFYVREEGGTNVDTVFEKFRAGARYL